MPRRVASDMVCAISSRSANNCAPCGRLTIHSESLAQVFTLLWIAALHLLSAPIHIDPRANGQSKGITVIRERIPFNARNPIPTVRSFYMLSIDNPLDTLKPSSLCRPFQQLTLVHG